MTVSRRLSRRGFLTAAAATSMAPLFLSARVMGKDGFVAPNDKINMALIGIGNRGQDHIGSFCGNNNFNLSIVCDCYDAHTERAKGLVDRRYGNTDCKMYKMYEEVYALPEIDVVSIASPDHWHTKMTVDACKAGKDVFCEKPLTLTLAEGRQIVQAARKYNRVCSSGSQRVMEDYGYMAPIIQSGAIGEVKEIHCGIGNPPWECYLPEEPIPAGMDWDRWLGQAPWAQYNGERCSGSYGGGWRNFYEYGNGFLADWGAHKFGGSLYACGFDHMVPEKIYAPNTEINPTPGVMMILPNGVKVFHNRNGQHDITIIGSEGTYRHRQTPDVKQLHAVNVRRYHGGATNITADFAFCVRNRVRPFQDVFYGARTAALCQLANCAYKLQRDLVWDDEKMVFVGDEMATRLVKRVQREPYTIEV